MNRSVSPLEEKGCAILGGEEKDFLGNLPPGFSMSAEKETFPLEKNFITSLPWESKGLEKLLSPRGCPSQDQ